MAKKGGKGDSPRDIVRKELNKAGLIVTVSTEKAGENLVAKLEISDAANDASVMKIMAVGKPMDISFSFGISASQYDIMNSFKEWLINSDFMKMLMPTFQFDESD